MLFFWTRESSVAAVTATPRAGPWFAWFATGMLLWRYRQPIARTVCKAASSIRFFKRHRHASIPPQPAKFQHKRQQQKYLRKVKIRLLSATPKITTIREHRRNFQQKEKFPKINNVSGKGVRQSQKPNFMAGKSRLKRLRLYEGSHIRGLIRKLNLNPVCGQISQQVYYKMTRSGRIYGRYHTNQTLIH